MLNCIIDAECSGKSVSLLNVSESTWLFVKPMTVSSVLIVTCDTLLRVFCLLFKDLGKANDERYIVKKIFF